MRWVFSGLGLGFPHRDPASPYFLFEVFFPKGTLELALCVSRLSEWGLIIFLETVICLRVCCKDFTSKKASLSCHGPPCQLWRSDAGSAGYEPKMRGQAFWKVKNVVPTTQGTRCRME